MSLPTSAFLFGLKIGSSVVIPAFDDNEDKGKVPEPLKTQLPATLTMQRVGPLSNENYRTVVFRLSCADGTQHRHEVKIRESRKEDLGSSVLSTLANPADPAQIPSPIPGVIDKTYITLGQQVRKGQVILSVAAMKMEVEVVAPFDGIVEKLCVQVGSKVDSRTLLAKLRRL